MGDMSQAISGLCHVVRTYTTSVRSPTLKPKSGSLKRVYDLTNAGPLHRFTVLTARGPLIVSNCILGLGFGMGKDNFQRTLKIGQGGFTLEMDIADCERTVNIYRTQYPMIPKLWKSAEEAIKAMAKGNEYELGVGIKLKCDHRGVHLPNGMIQRYDGLRWMKADGDKYRQDGYYYNSKYGPKYLYGPKLVENIVQALARIVVFNQMAIIDQKMKKFDRKMHPDARFKVVLTVHDEVLCVCPTAAVPKVEAMMLEVMSKPPRWAPELPIACEASHGRNYAEAK